MSSQWGFGSALHTLGTAGTATGTVVAARAGRKYCRIQNDSDTVVYLALGGAAALNSGIRLNGGGTAESVYEMALGKGNVYPGAIQAISSAASKLLLITEGI